MALYLEDLYRQDGAGDVPPRSDLELRIEAEADRFLSFGVALCIFAVVGCLLIAALL